MMSDGWFKGGPIIEQAPEHPELRWEQNQSWQMTIKADPDIKNCSTDKASTPDELDEQCRDGKIAE